MKKLALYSVAVIGLMGVAGTALAQDKQRQVDNGAKGGAAAGAAAGAVGGALVGGPVGAVVGGAVGAVGGAVTGATTAGITAEDRVYVQEYVVKRPVPSVRVQREVVVGETLPDNVTYYRIENNPRLEGYRYARVNDRYVIVDDSHRVIQVVE